MGDQHVKTHLFITTSNIEMASNVCKTIRTKLNYDKGGLIRFGGISGEEPLVEVSGNELKKLHELIEVSGSTLRPLS